MVCAARLSERVAGLTVPETARLSGLIGAAKLPVAPPKITRDRWLDLMRRDKKVQSGEMAFVVIERIGHASVRSDIGGRDIDAVIAG
jgi:3-dehydroquinate synthase